MTLQLGVPLWTEGGFTSLSAEDDLGIESVGAGLLRRLLPGIVQTTPHAGYYSYYPYLLARWEDTHDSVRKTDFKPWYRRQEAAYALACTLHEHRDGVYLTAISGRNAANATLASIGEATTVNVGRLAEPGGYMQSSYGGYGLFYGRVLADLRLTKAGEPGLVDRVTTLGREVAAQFAVAFESTEYFENWFDKDEVPLSVLRELGDAACLCGLPGRADHVGLMDAFLERDYEEPDWEAQRVTRVQSLQLFLDFHAQRPEGVGSTLDCFRMVLLSGHFPDGTAFEPNSVERLNSWRAYQLRETSVLAMGGLWVSYLLALEQAGPSRHAEIRGLLVSGCRWDLLRLDPGMTVEEAIALVESSVIDGQALLELANPLQDMRSFEPGEYVATALASLLRVRSMTNETAPGFDELLGEGGASRWSLSQQAAWFDHRLDWRLDELLASFLDDLVNQHRRIALSKVNADSKRDPFCLAEDDGLLTMIRSDKPFWTGARFGVVNHLLWTLGLLTVADEDQRLTPLGWTMIGHGDDA